MPQPNNHSLDNARTSFRAAAFLAIAGVTSAALGCGGGGGGGDDDDNNTGDPNAFPAELTAGDTFDTSLPQLTSIELVDETTAEVTTSEGTGLAAVAAYEGGSAARLRLVVLPDFQQGTGLIDVVATFPTPDSVSATGTAFSGAAFGPVTGTATFTDVP